MKTKMTMVYWKGDKYWIGKLLEHPEIMTQSRTLKELEENLKEAYLPMAMDDVPEEHQMKEITAMKRKESPRRLVVTSAAVSS